MEEVLFVVIQFVVEVLIELLVYLPFDLTPGIMARSEERTGFGWLVLYLVLGGAVGGLSLFIAPRLLIHAPPLRLANLIVAPCVAGLMSWGMATWRRSQGAKTCPQTHLWTAFAFVLAFSAVRLAYAAR